MYNQVCYKENKIHIFCKSKHPFEPYNIKKSKTIIIGSIPPYRFSEQKNLLCGDIDWYYGSKSNSFWDILKEACCDKKILLCTKEIQQKFLEKKEIGIFDMIDECTRKEECGSSDLDLYNIVLINSAKLISENINNNIKLFFTSQFVAGLFNQQTGAKLNLKIREKQNIQVCNKQIEAIILYSPSPSWSRGLKNMKEKSKEEKYTERIQQYKQICS